MTCESCIKDISGSLHKVVGIQKVEANLKEQLVSVEGTGSSHLSIRGIVTGAALDKVLIYNLSGALRNRGCHSVYWERRYFERFWWFREYVT
jgi:copper chaperone CopZ